MLLALRGAHYNRDNCTVIVNTDNVMYIAPDITNPTQGAIITLRGNEQLTVRDKVDEIWSRINSSASQSAGKLEDIVSFK